MLGFCELFEVLRQATYSTSKQLKRDGKTLPETDFWLLAKIPKLQGADVLSKPIYKVLSLRTEVDFNLEHESGIFTD